MTFLFPDLRRRRAHLLACVLATALFPLSAPPIASQATGQEVSDDGAGKNKEKDDPCQRIAEVPGNAKGLHNRCGPLGGGSGVARGDFNGDGVGDLAIGVPDENVNGATDAGAVNVIYGSASGGLTSTGNQFFTQDSAGIAGVPEASDRFGATLAAVDINGDGFSDLAIGTPAEDTDGVANEGFVQMMIGTANGLVAGQFYDFKSMEGVYCGCRFGAALAWGDFNDDGLGDLAIGMPFYTYERETRIGNVTIHTTLTDAGAVMVQFGDAPGAHRILEGLDDYDAFGWALAAGNRNGDGFDDLAVGHASVEVVRLYTGGTSGLTFSRSFDQADAGGTVENDGFGLALAFGDLDDDGRDELIVGAPFEKLGTSNDAGAVSIFYALPFPLRINRTMTQDDINGVDAEAGDQFGWAVAAADFDGDGDDDLAIGVPGEDFGSPLVFATFRQNAGMVHILDGQDDVGPVIGSEFWHQDISGVPGAVETGDQFGYSLSAWNFGRSTHADLVVGVPGEDITTDTVKTDAGAVIAIYGSASGLTATNSQFWSQASSGILDAADSDDRFGASVY